MRKILILLIFLNVGCDTKEKYVDRMSNPEAALEVAKAALHNRDLETYFDSVTMSSVRQTLKNSIAICSSSKLQQVQDYGYNESIGCDSILKKYGWIEPKEREPRFIEAAWNEAYQKITNPRKFAIELETHHRETGAGSSFVWSYLDPIVVVSTTINGKKARSDIMWANEELTITYEKDQTGWRVDPMSGW